MDTKIAFVTAGSRHTLCLDVNGKLWYFGAKEGVGIFSNEKKMQFEPILLDSESQQQQQSFEKGFTLIDAGDSVNIALSADDQSVYCFGKRILDETLRKKSLGKTYAWENEYDDVGGAPDEDSKVHSTTFDKISMKACYVSCGLEHCIIIDQDNFIPLSWGDNANYRCGQKQLGYFEEPVAVKPFPKLFKQENI